MENAEQRMINAHSRNEHDMNHHGDLSGEEVSLLSNRLYETCCFASKLHDDYSKTQVNRLTMPYPGLTVGNPHPATSSSGSGFPNEVEYQSTLQAVQLQKMLYGSSGKAGSIGSGSVSIFNTSSPIATASLDSNGIALNDLEPESEGESKEQNNNLFTKSLSVENAKRLWSSFGSQERMDTGRKFSEYSDYSVEAKMDGNDRFVYPSGYGKENKFDSAHASSARTSISQAFPSVDSYAELNRTRSFDYPSAGKPVFRQGSFSPEILRGQAVAGAASPNDLLYSYKEKLLSLVSFYKKSCNNGYGLIPIINSFTAKHKFQTQDGLNERAEVMALMQLQKEYPQLDLSYGFAELLGRTQKKKDFCSKIEVTSGMTTVLIEVEFVKKQRWGLFQAVDFLVETGEKLVNLIDKEVVMEMDGGIDLAVLRTIEYMPLLGGIQEVPFMPVLRRPTHFDMMKYESKDADECIVLRFCRELLKYPEFMHYNMTVTDVEFQIDRQKLIIFGEFVAKVKFNKYVKQVYEHCKHVFKRRNIKPRIFIQNKFLKQF